MRGDVLIINNYHRKAARQAVDMLLHEIRQTEGKYFITVAGESGAGKSEVAASIASELEKQGIAACVIQQDDYFVYPPLTNAEKRREDIGWVGMQEVKLSLIDEEIAAMREGKNIIEKPLVIFSEDTITTEKVDFSPYRVVIVEGTYTTALRNADTRIFINRDINDTRKARKKRAREAQDEFLERVLTIEHRIISAQKKDADIIITKKFDVIKKKDHDG